MDISNFFDSFFTIESIAAMVLAILAFLFGVLFGYVVWGTRMRRYRRSLAEKEKELANLSEQINNQQEQLELKEADLQKASFEIAELKEKVRLVELEKEQLQTDLLSVNVQLEKLEASNKTYLATIEDLNNQILGLKTKNNQLLLELEKEDDTWNDLARMQSTYNATLSRLETIENKLDKLEGDNAVLKTELSDIKSIPVATPVVEYNDESDLSAIAEESLLKKALGERIELEPSEERDDLQQIEGVGPFIEQKLNTLGIYTYEQISQFNTENIDEITDALDYFPGRIERDDWVGQAAKLHLLKMETPEAFVAKDIAPTIPDDLKVIEGIGPKIETILHNADILTWKELAIASVEKLKQILETAGKRYRRHDPTTWPDQAQLASQGEWDRLKEYQEYLSGGRDVGEVEDA
ncbi:MAG: DUF1049 domain-containing protein [Bacteroidetes bacterium]|nr:DUF1049 domain-containing protein [Bacteroidota bacterium]